MQQKFELVEESLAYAKLFWLYGEPSLTMFKFWHLEDNQGFQSCKQLYRVRNDQKSV